VTPGRNFESSNSLWVDIRCNSSSTLEVVSHASADMLSVTYASKKSDKVEPTEELAFLEARACI
jgi:hypothetical protein